MSDELGVVQSHGLNPDNTVRFGRDDKMIVRFYKRAVVNQFESQKIGRAISEGVDYFESFEPGDKYTKVDRPVKDSDKMRYPIQWANYLQNKEQVAKGTPLDYLFPGQPEVVANLRALRIGNIEQLAKLTDSNAKQLQFGEAMREDAKKYIEGAKKGETFHALKAELDTKSAEIKELREMVNALTAKLTATDDKRKAA